MCHCKIIKMELHSIHSLHIICNLINMLANCVTLFVIIYDVIVVLWLVVTLMPLFAVLFEIEEHKIISVIYLLGVFCINIHTFVYVPVLGNGYFIGSWLEEVFVV